MNFKKLLFSILHPHNRIRLENYWQKAASSFNGTYVESLSKGRGMEVQISGSTCFIGGSFMAKGQLSELICYIESPRIPNKDPLYLTTVATLLKYGSVSRTKIHNVKFDDKFKVFCKSQEIINNKITDETQHLLLSLIKGQKISLDIWANEELRIDFDWFRIDLSPTIDELFPDLEKLIKHLMN